MQTLRDLEADGGEVWGLGFGGRPIKQPWLMVQHDAGLDRGALDAKRSTSVVTDFCQVDLPGLRYKPVNFIATQPVLSFVKRLNMHFCGKNVILRPSKKAFRCRDEKSETTFKMKVSKLFHECRPRIPMALFTFLDNSQPLENPRKNKTKIKVPLEF